MALKTPAQIAAAGDAHGFRAISYLVEVSADPGPTTFAAPGPWTEAFIKVQTSSIGYGTGAFTCRFLMWDENTALNMIGGPTSLTLTPVKNGDLIRVKVVDNRAGGVQKYIFQGTVRSVNEQRRGDGGTQYQCEAISTGERLNDIHITASFNRQNDPINASPRFDSNGYLVEGVSKTVAEIVDEILDFKDAWETSEYFKTSDITWHGLKTSKRLGKYILGEVTFNNTKKGNAIAEVLNRAGNFTYFYSPQDDNIHIIELNATGAGSGNLWDIRWPQDPGFATDYAYEHDVYKDSTVWSTRETINSVRISGPQIRFYSGNYIIPNQIAELSRSGSTAVVASDAMGDHNQVGVEDGATRDKHVVDDAQAQDSVADQRLRGTAMEGYYYHFEDQTNVQQDYRDLQRMYVGLPLFPDWNVLEDFLPAELEIQDVEFPMVFYNDVNDRDSGIRTDRPNKDSYVGQIEFMPYSIGDSIVRGEFTLNRSNNLRVYQAWWSEEECPACSGSGAVAAIYSGNNLPSYSFNTPNGRLVSRVTNYIFDPNKFGTIDPNSATGELFPPNGLTPFNGSDYAHPSFNFCPYCRGTGRKPEYKIRNIQEGLAQGRGVANAAAPTGTAEGTIPIDPDVTQTGPETWAEAQSRLLIKLNPQLQFEANYTTARLPAYNIRNQNIGTIPASDTPYEFKHPIDYGFAQRLHSVAPGGVDNPPATNPVTLEDDPNSVAPQTDLVDPEWKCHATFATVMPELNTGYSIDSTMGTVTFNDPVYIACIKDWMEIQFVDSTRIQVSGTQLLQRQEPFRTGAGAQGKARKTVDGSGMATGYWRPARAWLTFFYAKDEFYQNPLLDNAGAAIDEVSVTAPDPDSGITDTYRARAMILDGQYILEVREAVADSGTEFGTGNRIIQAAIDGKDNIIEVFEEDFYKKPVPTEPDWTDVEFEEHKDDDYDYRFSRGKILKWLTTTPQEAQLEMAGYSAQDFQNNPVRPRLYSFRMRDDRSRMLGKAIRILEAKNDILVTGSVTLDGKNVDITNGLGYVDYPERGINIIKKIVYHLDGKFHVELEINREVARFGELVPAEEEKINDIEKKISRFERNLKQQQKLANVPGRGSGGKDRDREWSRHGLIHFGAS